MRKIKTAIKNWLGINEIESSLETAIDSLNTNLSTAAEFSAKNRNKLNDILEDLRNAESELEDLRSEVGNLEYDLSEKSTEYDVDEKVEGLRYDLENEMLTRSDITEMILEEQSEVILNMVENTVETIEQRNFDYDLVVSQVVRIIVEKLNS